MGVPEGKGKEREEGKTRPTCVIVDEVDGAAGGGDSVRWDAWLSEDERPRIRMTNESLTYD